MRAVNTVVFKDGRRIGHNTDRSGFEESFRREMADVRLGRVVQFGAGGGGAAVACALLRLGVGELVHHRQGRGARERSGADHVRGLRRPRAGRRPMCREAMDGADGLVNATPLGMARYPGMALPAELLRPDLWVADIVYFPLETELLRAGASARLPDHGRRRHGRVSGRARVSPVQRMRGGRRAHAEAFPGDVRGERFF